MSNVEYDERTGYYHWDCDYCCTGFSSKDDSKVDAFADDHEAKCELTKDKRKPR